MDLKRYETLKNNVDRLQREVNRIEGALQTQQTRLRTDYDCESVEEAEAELKRLEGELSAKGKQFDEELVAFEKEYKDLLSKDEE
jgi:hypothetical protein